MQLHYCNIYVVVQVFYPEPIILSYEGLTNYCGATHDVTILITGFLGCDTLNGLFAITAVDYRLFIKLFFENQTCFEMT
jgi:hypothetical protein